MFHIHILTFTNWIHLHPGYAGIAAFIIAFSESIAIVGSIIPGSVTMTAIGILIGSGTIPIWSTLVWAISGAFLGDGTSYIFGYFFKNKTHNLWPFSSHPKLLAKGQDFFLHYGVFGIILGRFIGPARAITPIIAGMFDMKPKKYFPISLFASIAWAPCYMLPGFLLGAASVEMPPSVAAELLIGVLLVLTAIWLIVWFINKIYQLSHEYFAMVLDAKWQVWETQKGKKWLCFLLRNADRPNRRGQLLPAIVGTISALGFLIVFFHVKYNGALINLNNRAYHFFRGLRTVSMHKIMVIISCLGYEYSLFIVVCVVLGYLIFSKRLWAALHFFAAIFFATAIAFAFRYLFYYARPPGIMFVKATSSFPSGHMVVTSAFYGFIAYLLASNSTKYFKNFIYWTAATIIIIIAISRLYLCQHWLTDVIGAFFLSFSVLLFTVISYRRFPRKKIHPTKLLAIILISIIPVFTYFIHKDYQNDLNKTGLFWPIKTADFNAWWNNNNGTVPLYRNDRLGNVIDIFNIEWAGNLNDITTTLIENDWITIEKRDYVTTLKKVAEEQDIHPPFSLFKQLYDDQSPEIEMAKITDDGKTLILRIWDANINLLPQKIPLYIGKINYNIDSQKHLIFFHKKIKRHSDTNEIYAVQSALKNTTWLYKIVNLKALPPRFKYMHALFIKPKDNKK